MTEAYRKLTACRVCASSALTTVLRLGEQALTGVFPRTRDEKVTTGPLDLVKCLGPCGLVQLGHSYSTVEMYGDNYGYRSGLNRSMVEHLRTKVATLRAHVPVGKGDIVLDIGANDGTTLSFYPENGARLIGIDPTSAKFAKYYRPDIERVAQFFTAETFRAIAGGRKAKIVTSLSVFYDLEAPLAFMRDVHDVLADDGIWHFEQSYLPAMLSSLAYDTICHEHLEYYGLSQIVWMAEETGFVVRDVSLNPTNGGSFAVTVAKAKSGESRALPAEAERLLAKEKELALHTVAPYLEFAAAVAQHRLDLKATIAELRSAGKRVFGMGASTKGNVLLQYCGLTEDDLTCIAEVNEDKFGHFTPGTGIPIVSEAEAAAKSPDAYLVLPWHFRDGLLRRHASYLEAGGTLLFPLPTIEACSGAS